MSEAGKRRGAGVLFLLLIVVLLLWLLLQDDDATQDQVLEGDPAPPPAVQAPPIEAKAPTTKAPPPEPVLAPPPVIAPVPTLKGRFDVREDLYFDLVMAARQYFNLDEEHWKGRIAFLAELEKHAKEGRWFLKDMRALRWLVAQARWHEPPLSDRKWQRQNGITKQLKRQGTLRWIQTKTFSATYSVPQEHWENRKLEQRFPRPPPYPLLLSLHEPQDHAALPARPGEALLKRRYPAQEWTGLYDEWLVLAPEIGDGSWLAKNGFVAGALRSALAQFWRHYHVDLHRVVVDGAKPAFGVATSMPIFFSGVVLRGDWTLESDAEREQVRNFAPLPVYVVDNIELATQLTAAGHPRVTSGGRGAKLRRWMRGRRTRLPKRFRWTVGPKRYDQVLPYWINLDKPDWKAERRTLSVEIVNTEEEPNTIRIDAEGILALTLFLNDDLVDLDRPVRVVLNGRVEHDKIIPIKQAMREAVGRDLDLLFNREPVRIRTSMFYAWLHSARVINLEVRAR